MRKKIVEHLSWKQHDLLAELLTGDCWIRPAAKTEWTTVYGLYEPCSGTVLLYPATRIAKPVNSVVASSLISHGALAWDWSTEELAYVRGPKWAYYAEQFDAGGTAQEYHTAAPMDAEGSVRPIDSVFTEALDALYPSILKFIICNYYGFGTRRHTLSAIGRMAKRSRGWANMHLAKALRKLRRNDDLLIKAVKPGNRGLLPHQIQLLVALFGGPPERLMEVKLAREAAILVRKAEQAAISEKQRSRPNMAICVEDLEFSLRTRNCLNNANIRVVGELVRMSAEDLLQVKHLGRKSLKEIKETVASLGLELGMNALWSVNPQQRSS